LICSSALQVYELRGQAWEDRGTGFVEGIYDEASDEALLVVTREESNDPANGPEQGDVTGQGENENEAAEPGGFFREGEDPFLLRTRVGKADPYSRQQGEYRFHVDSSIACGRYFIVNESLSYVQKR
jgi:hypothetical protein